MAWRILIVDDDEAQGAFLIALLRRQSMEPRHVTSANEALAALQEQPFDVVLTDIYMPDCDGIELLRRVKQIKPNLPVIAMTGAWLPITSTIDRIFRLMGGVALLLKPICVTELLTILTALSG